MELNLLNLRNLSEICKFHRKYQLTLSVRQVANFLLLQSLATESAEPADYSRTSVAVSFEIIHNVVDFFSEKIWLRISIFRVQNAI